MNQKAPQEINSLSMSFEEKKQKLQEETQKFMYAQSRNFSSVSRNLVFGILGTIWVLTYVDSQLKIPNTCLTLSLFLGFIFLIVDVFHYYRDSKSYQYELYSLDGYKTEEELNNRHEARMDEINRRSHCFLEAKFWLLLFASFLFFLGLLGLIMPYVIK